MPINAEEIIQWLQREDPAAFAAAQQAGENFPREAERALPHLSPTAREMVAQALATNNTPDSARVLLDMTGDPEPQVAVAAARGLSGLTKSPALAELLAVLPRRQEPVVRSVLYRVAGRIGKSQDVAAVRAVVALEKDEEAGEDGQVAVIRLGGTPEKTAFLARIRAATPDQAVRICDQLRYTEQKPLLKAMLPWLANRQEVMRIGSDRTPHMARMCDIAVWTAHQMALPLQPKPTSLDNYPQPVLDQARDALLALPD